ncbi:MAG: Sporulation integral membrane protein YlbJ [Lachnoclostridium sp.]|jgi:sporulation integral membrane protein YlbJ
MKTNHIYTMLKKDNKKKEWNQKSIRNSKLISKAGIVLFLFVILLFPASSYTGAKKGLLLWFNTVLPSLLPFIIVSNLIIGLGLTKPLGKFFYPLFHTLFGISRGGCYPVLIGFLSGIPVGAKTVADLVEDGSISVKEGQYLLGFCNNASPVFIMSYIAISQLNLPQARFHLLLIIYLSGIFSAFLLFRFLPNVGLSKKNVVSVMGFEERGINCSQPKSYFSLLDSSIMNGFEVITKVGGYIILFSIPAQIISSLGTNGSYLKLLSIGLLEITTGINQISLSGLKISTKIALITMITAFGGLSGIAQTKSVINNTRLSVGIYMKSKLLHMLLALFLSYLYARFILPA